MPLFYPDRYSDGHPVRAMVSRIERRDDLDALQRELRELPGVSVIVYEQMCATEKRRLRKRGKIADPSTRVFINELVCEGCGDRSVKSNCLSVEPIETRFGTKRRINQSSCNKDMSCLTGFCPSFVTVEGGKPRRAATATGSDFDPASLPLPARAGNAHQRMVIAGVGGTGVVTIGALVAMAAHIDGRGTAVLDQVGLAQKGGAVVSHVHIADEPITALRVPTGAASLVLVCDEIVGNMRDVMASVSPGRTYVLANSDVSITGDFTNNRNAKPDATLLTRRLEQQAGPGRFAAFPFSRLAERLLGDAIGSNLMMVGYAWQRGWLALDLSSFEAAVVLNGTAVSMNRAGFLLGRRLAVEPDSVFAAAGLGEPAAEPADDIVATPAAFLADYQDDAYAARFRAVVERVAAAEAACGGNGALRDIVARGLFRLMAYKDEYEVARLYTDGQFRRAMDAAFEGDVKLTFHMAPPILAKRDKVTGHLRKRAFGRWIMLALRLLAQGRRLCGTALDPFGRTAERKAERQMIDDYETLIEQLIAGLNASNLSEALRIAGLIQDVRGYGHVKEQAMAAHYDRVAAAIADYEAPAAQRQSLKVAV